MPGETTIDSLQIEIQAGAKDAEQGLDALKGALDKLRSALKDGAGLSSLAASFREMGDKADQLGTTSAANIEKLVQALRDLQGVGKLNLEGTANGIEKVNKASEKAAATSGNVVKRLLITYASLRGIGRTIASLIDKSNTYVENLNLFNASLGKYASSAQEYAQQVADLMGIDPAQWLRTQGVFQTLAEGFGVTSDRAIIMSKNLTQLGYDLSSFFNIAVDGVGGSMQKLQAAFSGELEPLRRLGFDLSEARLKAVALSLGIDQTFNSMTQAQKAQLRYYAILTQVTTAQGDMARTLNTPANQLRIFKAQVEQAGRSIGNIFIPALNAILPVAIAATQAIRMVAEAIAKLIGFEYPEIDYSGISGATNATEDLDSALTSAGGSAKKLKDLLADWDELNIIQSESGGGGGGSGKGVINPEDWAFDLPEYDFLKQFTESRVGEILEGWKPTIQWITDHIKEIAYAAEGAIAMLAGWKIANTFSDGIKLAETSLGKILDLAGAIGIAYASIKLNIKFTNEWLESGNWGALAASVGTDLFGASLAGKLVEKMLTGSPNAEMLGTWTSAAVLMINGGTKIDLALNDITAQGFTTENVVALLLGSGAFSLGAYKMVSALADTLLGKGKAKFGAKSAATFYLLAGVGLSVFFSKTASTIDMQEDFGTWALAQAGSMIAPIAAGLLAGRKLGLTWTNEAGKLGGMGTALGLSMAIPAAINLFAQLKEVINNGITEDKIKTKMYGLLPSIITGAAGLALVGGSLLGLGIGATAGIGVGLAIAMTVGAYFILQANKAEVEALPNITITWGTTGLTEDQIKQKVSSYFNFDVTAKVKSLTAVVDDLDTVKADINADILDIQKDLDKIYVGVDLDDSLDDLTKKLIGDGGENVGLIGNLKALISKNQIPIKLLFTADADLSEDEKATLSAMDFIEADVQLTLTTLGETWAKWVGNGFADEFKEEAMNALKEVQAITNAVTGAQIEAKFNLAMSKIGLAGVTKESFSGILNEYKNARNELWQGYTKRVDDAYQVALTDLRIAETRLSQMEKGTTEYKEMSDAISALKVKVMDFELDIKYGYKSQKDEFNAQVRDSETQFLKSITGIFADNDFKKLFIKGFEEYLTGKQYGSEAELMSALGAGVKAGKLDNVMNQYFDDPAMWTLMKSLIGDPSQLLSAIIGHSMSLSEYIAPQAPAPAPVEQDPRLKELYYKTLKTAPEWLSKGDEYYTDELSDLQALLIAYRSRAFEAFKAGDVNNLSKLVEILNTGYDTYEAYANNDWWAGQMHLEELQELINDYSWLGDTVTLEIDSTEAITSLGYLDTAWSELVEKMQNNSLGMYFRHWADPNEADLDEFSGGGGRPVMGGTFVSKGLGATQSGYIIQSTAVNGSDAATERNVADGVREGNDEQNALLREQNTILRGILNKTGVVTPSTALARTIKRSNEMLSGVEGAVAAFAAGL